MKKYQEYELSTRETEALKKTGSIATTVHTRNWVLKTPNLKTIPHKGENKKTHDFGNPLFNKIVLDLLWILDPENFCCCSSTNLHFVTILTFSFGERGPPSREKFPKLPVFSPETPNLMNFRWSNWSDLTSPWRVSAPQNDFGMPHITW